MKKACVFFLIISLFVLSYAGVVNDFNEPSTFSRAIGGAIYALYEGAQSVSYNPAGIASGKGEVYFSHAEHFLGVIRNEFLSASLQFGDIAIGGAVQYTYPIDGLNYYQYKFVVGMAYRFGKNSIGMEMNRWKGNEIYNGQSFDFGMIMNFSKFNLDLTVKNLFSSITWSSTSTAESYSPEFVFSAAYFADRYTLSGYVNATSKEMGIGVIWPLTNFLDAMGGWKMSFSKALSKELSVGLRASYYNFILDVCYTFKDPIEFRDVVSPFYISLTYDFMKGM